MKYDIMVSILCVCYNHKQYIRDTLNGFLSQRTSFKYEIIIHDDASTDGTDKIIHEYQEKYPEMIIGLYETENQYSKGVRLQEELMEHLVRGKYTALCEGDDYWIDTNKLQKQVDFLENHSNYSICGHSINIVDEKGDLISSQSKKNTGGYEIPIKDIILNSKGAHTSSLVYRSDLKNQYPRFFQKCMVGDYPIRLYMATRGKFYMFNKAMSCYRVHGENSWISDVHNNPELFKRHVFLLKKMLVKYDAYTNEKYSKYVNLRLSNCDYHYYILVRNYTKLLKNQYFKSLSLKQKIKSLYICTFANKRKIKD